MRLADIALTKRAGPGGPMWPELAADEVIRQMEWARRECPDECGHCGRGEGPSPLTLAPDDWKP
jgi:hypothetical protein